MPELPDIAAYLHALETHTRDANANLTQITSPNGRSISLTYDALNRITSATDNAGRTVSYSYDSGGRLQTVTDVNGGITTFAYDANDLMTSITDARNITYLTNQYDSFGRVIQQTQADGGTYLFNWTPSSNSVQQWVIHRTGQPIRSLYVRRIHRSDFAGSYHRFARLRPRAFF